VALVWAAIGRRYRGKLLAVLRRDHSSIAIASLLGAALLWPLLGHYLEMSRMLGTRSMPEVFLGIPNYRSWLYMGPESWLYGWLPRIPWFKEFGPRETEHRIGIGWLTPLAAVVGLWLGRADPVMRILGLTSLTLYFLATLIPREIILGLALVEWLLCAAIFVRSRGKRRIQLLAVALFGLLSWILFPPTALVAACTAAGLMLAVGETLLRRFRSMLDAIAGAACGLFLVLSTYPDRPGTLITLALGVLAAIALKRGAKMSLTPLELTALVLATAAHLAFTQGSLILWNYVYALVPAGGVIRVPARVSLLLLIPLSLGFARFWEWFVNRAGWRYAVPLGVFCLLEQGISTSSFDKKDAQARIQAAAAWVERDGKPRAFFYSSQRPGLPNWNDHVDAMWAGLAAGVPTVNGYSSSYPQLWAPLYKAAICGKGDEDFVRSCLRRWLQTTGIPLEEIKWVHDGRRLPINRDGRSDSTEGP
jgi:hypothetical protein